MKHTNYAKILLSLGLLLTPIAFAQAAHEPLKVIQTNEMTFPFSMIRTQRQGEARVAINVDSQGELKDILILGYTKKPFADTAVEALKSWKFEPARVDGEPIGAVSEVKVDFTATGVVVSQSINETLEVLYDMAYQNRRQYEYSLCTLKDIDRIPVPINVIRPAYPVELAKQNIVGKVSVIFFIDETGTVRMPAVMQSDNSVLADLAMAALKQWKFEPPMRKGSPVLVRAVQLFTFVPGKMVEMKASP